MNRGRTTAKYLALLGGIAVAMSASNLASAQPPCPLGFDYVPGYGCELPNPFYGPPDDGYDAPPVVPFYYYGGGWNRRGGRDGGHHERSDFGHGDPGREFGRARR
jgi:hypothetical protein